MTRQSYACLVALRDEADEATTALVTELGEPIGHFSEMQRTGSRCSADGGA
jgi:hypothetical protein